MANDFALLGAFVATRNLTFDDAAQIAEFAAHVKAEKLAVPDLAAGIDLALGYFNDAPEVEAAKIAEAVEAAHDAGTCPDCGGDMMDEVDMDQAIDLWVAVRMVADKYAFDREYDGGGRGDPEEC